MLQIDIINQSKQSKLPINLISNNKSSSLYKKDYIQNCKGSTLKFLGNISDNKLNVHTNLITQQSTHLNNESHLNNMKSNINLFNKFYKQIQAKANYKLAPLVKVELDLKDKVIPKSIISLNNINNKNANKSFNINRIEFLAKNNNPGILSKSSKFRGSKDETYTINLDLLDKPDTQNTFKILNKSSSDRQYNNFSMTNLSSPKKSH